jgi:hypothetical protein
MNLQDIVFWMKQPKRLLWKGHADRMWNEARVGNQEPFGFRFVQHWSLTLMGSGLRILLRTWLSQIMRIHLQAIVRELHASSIAV